MREQANEHGAQTNKTWIRQTNMGATQICRSRRNSWAFTRLWKGCGKLGKPSKPSQDHIRSEATDHKGQATKEGRMWRRWRLDDQLEGFHLEGGVEPPTRCDRPAAPRALFTISHFTFFTQYSMELPSSENIVTKGKEWVITCNSRNYVWIFSWLCSGAKTKQIPYSHIETGPSWKCFIEDRVLTYLLCSWQGIEW